MALVVAVISLIGAVVGYVGAQKAKKAAKAAMDRARGVLVQGKDSIAPRRIIYGTKRIGGLEAYFTTSGDKNQYLYYVLIWSEGPNDAVEALYLDEDEVTFSGQEAVGKYNGWLWMESHMGDESARLSLAAEIPGWAATDRLWKISHSIIKLKYSEDTFPNGVPNLSGRIRGRNDVKDPRITGYPSGYSTNPALCLAHYFSLPKKLGPGLDWELNNDLDQLALAADACDAPVNLLGGGTEPTYTFNGIVDLDLSGEDIVSAFRQAMAGVTVWTGKKWRIYPGRYVTPTFELQAKHLVGPVQLKTRASKRDRFNTVRGVFAPASGKYQPTGFPPVVSADALAADGEELAEDLELTNTESASMCRRISKIVLLHSRFSRTVQVACNVEAFRAQPGLPIFFHFPELKFNHTPMDVVSWELAVEDGAIIINMQLRETDPSIFDWDPSEETALVITDPSPSVRPDPGEGASVTDIYGNVTYGQLEAPGS